MRKLQQKEAAAALAREARNNRTLPQPIFTAHIPQDVRLVLLAPRWLHQQPGRRQLVQHRVKNLYEHPLLRRWLRIA